MIAAWTSKYIGIPFVSGGRDLSGCDCYGLLRLILCSEFSVSLPDLSDLYQDAINHSGISPLFDTYLPLIAGEKKDTPEIGDAVLIRIHDRPVHIATYIGDNHIINILRNVGSFIQSLHSADLAGRIEGFYHVASYNR